MTSTWLLKRVLCKLLVKYPYNSKNIHQKIKANMPSKSVPAGMQVPYEVKDSEFGKGVFAKQNIKKGTFSIDT